MDVSFSLLRTHIGEKKLRGIRSYSHLLRIQCASIRAIHFTQSCLLLKSIFSRPMRNRRFQWIRAMAVVFYVIQFKFCLGRAARLLWAPSKKINERIRRMEYLMESYFIFSLLFQCLERSNRIRFSNWSIHSTTQSWPHRSVISMKVNKCRKKCDTQGTCWIRLVRIGDAGSIRSNHLFMWIPHTRRKSMR